jgi:hypothetical protein
MVTPAIATRQPLTVSVAATTYTTAFHRALGRTSAKNPISIADIAAGFTPTPQFDLHNFGGKTIQNLTFTNLYVGGSGAWNAADITAIDAALAAALADQNLNNVMMQYFKNLPITSAFKPSTVLAGAAPAHFSQASIEQLVNTLAGSHQFDGFDLANTVFNFMLPSGVVLTAGPDSSLNGLGGFHGQVTSAVGNVYYAVGVFSENRPGQGQNGIVGFPEPWKNVVATFYHELNEARTDADTNGKSGWLTKPLPEFNGQSLEIGDIPMFEAGANLSLVMQEVPLTGGKGTVPIQLMYSNAVHGPEGPIPAPHVAPAPPPHKRGKKPPPAH